MKKTLITIIIVLVLLALYYTLNQQTIDKDITVIESEYEQTSEIPTQPDIMSEATEIFEDADLGLSFEYPSGPTGYVIEEAPMNNNDDPDLLKALILTRTSDYEEFQMNEGGREGPPTINILVFDDNDSDLNAWLLEKSSFTGYQENIGEPTNVDDQEGITYSWEGLYEGETVAIQKNNKIYLFIGTYSNGVIDDRQTDFENLLETMQFDF